MSKKLNVLVSFISNDNAWILADGGDSFGFINYAFDGYDKTDAQDIIIDNPDGHCYNMAVASYYDMLEEYDEYEEVLFKAVIASQIHVSDDETYTIIKESRNTFLVKFYQEYDEDEDDEDEYDEDDIIYINDKPYVDTGYREAYWFTDLRFTDKGTTEPKDVECKIWEAFEEYEEEYFEEYFEEY